jgi:hypothetical protein
MDLNHLTPDDIASLKAQLAMTDTNGRSPFRPRQLHDLKLQPTATDSRPMFVWSAESPRDAGDLTRTTEFPKLMWHRTTGEEITVHSKDEQIEQESIYTTEPPEVISTNPYDAIRDALDSLSPEERVLVVEAQQQARMKTLQEKLAALPADQLEALLNGQGTTPAKRRPGRPRKEVA